MKTNRQNKLHSHRQKQNNRSSYQPFFQFQNNVQEKTTLASLILNFNCGEIVKLVCMNEVAVHIQSLRDVSRKSGRSTSRRTCRTVSNGIQQGGTLRQFLNNFQMHPEKKYVFSAKSKSEGLSRYILETKEKHKNSSFLSKTSSEVSLKQFSSSKKSSAQKQKGSGLFEVEGSCMDSNNSNMKRFLSQKQLGNELMFTVQQLKESVQSQARESIKQNHEKENRNGFNFNTLDIKGPTMTKHYLERLKKSKNQQQKKFEQQGLPVPIKVVQTKQQQRCQEHILKQSKQSIMDQQGKDKLVFYPVNQMNQINQVNQLQTSPESRFSFATNLKKGLIHNQSSCVDGEMSFKIMGDNQLEIERNKGQQGLGCSSIAQIDELSSIISNAREQTKRQSNQEIDSIKCDLEDMKKFTEFVGNKGSTVGNRMEVERLDLNSIAEMRQKDGYDESIQITEKKQNESDKVQFTVRYNVRFLERKNQATEVVRLSPLRFRRREQLVSQLVRAKVVSKQSDSINIV